MLPAIYRVSFFLPLPFLVAHAAINECASVCFVHLRLFLFSSQFTRRWNLEESGKGCEALLLMGLQTEDSVAWFCKKRRFLAGKHGIALQERTENGIATGWGAVRKGGENRAEKGYAAQHGARNGVTWLGEKPCEMG